MEYTVDEIKSELSNACRENRRIPDEVQRLNQDNAALQTQMQKMEVRLDYMDDQGRRNNFRICGVPEEAGANWEKCQHKVENMLRDRFNIRPTFERISRVGKPSSPQHPRDIIVRFSSFSVRDQILRNRIFINEDFCPGTVEVRKNQMEKYHAARSGKFVFFNYRTLVVKEPRSGSGSENTKVSSAGLASTTPPPALSASPNDVSRSASDVAAASLALPTPLRDTPRDNQPRFRKQTDFFKPS